MSIKYHLTNACEGYTISGMKILPDMDPYLNGYWDDNWAHTYQHQSCLLGIPSMQLKMPHKVRKALNTDSIFRNKFTNALVNI